MANFYPPALAVHNSHRTLPVPAPHPPTLRRMYHLRSADLQPSTRCTWTLKPPTIKTMTLSRNTDGKANPLVVAYQGLNSTSFKRFFFEIGTTRISSAPFDIRFSNIYQKSFSFTTEWTELQGKRQHLLVLDTKNPVQPPHLDFLIFFLGRYFYRLRHLTGS